MALTLEQKIAMMLHQNDPEQFSIQLIMLLHQHFPNLNNLDSADSKLESLLNSLIYEKYVGLCQIEATKARMKSCDQRMAILNAEAARQLRSIFFLHDKGNLLSYNTLSNHVYLNIYHMYEDFKYLNEPRGTNK